MSDLKTHWDTAYASKQPSEMSWYKPRLGVSLELIQNSGIALTDHIIDVGGGASTLVDDLLDRGFKDITVLDISSNAIDIARTRLAQRADRIHWMVDDVLHARLEQGGYRLWHDRAALHFFSKADDRAKYVRQLQEAVCPGGFAVVSTFSSEGPNKCSGLEVYRYTPESLLAEFGETFHLIDFRSENHRTPSGNMQAFLYCLFSFEGPG